MPIWKRTDYLTARVEICKGHAKADDSDDSPTESVDDSGRNGHVRKQHYCPIQGCQRRSAPFASRQRLRRHFEQHVECEEVCVFCHRVMKSVRTFIRHTEVHKYAGGTKLTYMNKICEELRDRASEELEDLENRRLNSDSASTKRTCDMAELDNHSAGSRRRKRDDVGQTRDNLQSSSANGVYPFKLILDQAGVAEGGVLVQERPASNQLAANVVPLAIGTDRVANALASMQTDVLAANSALESTGILDDLDFVAPVNGIVNFPNFLEPWPA
ncbi:hypothetical protein J3458_015599 [Metarhizium acridum]|uniref:uncharacterized protein n=1 Tax=Metarhizium acridum TaxID=92637 RepID=UPI001C6CE4F0|nr:hypothetical protein J3458_015599 [Metarhizium acridum]